MAEIIVGIITISDKAFSHERVDQSGPALMDFCRESGWFVTKTSIINDDYELIRSTLLDYCELVTLNLVLTTGGTGVSPRDNTPEATISVIEKVVPGISEYIRRISYEKNPNTLISRSVSGIRNGKLIINLPGSPKGAIESLDAVKNVIPHAIELISGFQPH